MTSIFSKLIILALWIIGEIPPNLRSRLGRGIGRLVALVPSRQRDIAEHSLTRFLGPKGSPNRPSVSDVYASIAQSAAEMANFDPYLANLDRYFDFRDQAVFDDVRSRNRGMVVLVGHIGNWDILGAYFVQIQKLPVFTAARKARKKFLQPGLAWLRNRFRIRTAWRDDRGAVRSIVQTIREGGVVASLVDQDTEVESEKVPFFGIMVKTPNSMVNLALRQEIPIVATFAIRDGLNRYRIHFMEIVDRKDACAVLTVFHQRLEALIRENPDQWAWFHKRWRTQGGKRLSTPEYLQWLTETTPPFLTAQE